MKKTVLNVEEHFPSFCLKAGSGNMANFARGFTLPNPSAVISDVSFSCLDHGLV
jgi:hypothetical protein